MELKKQLYRYFRPIYTATLQKEESGDAIVPDSNPDIQNIVMTSGMACLKDKYVRDGQLEVSGIVKATVLYMPDGQDVLRKLEVNLPFNHTIEHTDINSDVIANAVPTVISAETRMLNPRKVQVTVALAVSVDVMASDDCEVSSGVEDEDNVLQTLTQTQTACMLVSLREKDFTVSDEIELPASKPPIDELLLVNIVPTVHEVKVIGNKMVFKGSATLSILYTTPDSGAVASFDQELPFSQIVEMEDLQETCDSTIDLQLVGLEIDVRTGISLEARVLGVTLPMTAFATARLERQIETLADVYATNQDCQLQHASYTFSQIGERQERYVPVRELVETGIGVQTVYDTRIVLGTPTLQQGEGNTIAMVDAHIRILYSHDDGGFATATRRMSIPCPIDGGDWNVSAALTAETSCAATQEGMELRFGIDFTLTKTEEVTLNTIASIELTPFAEDSAPRPSVVLRRAHTNERLWNIAKHYKTTIADIQSANQLEDDIMMTSKMLLIPKKR